MDILTATRFGTFVFWGKPGAFRKTPGPTTATTKK